MRFQPSLLVSMQWFAHDQKMTLAEYIREGMVERVERDLEELKSRKNMGGIRPSFHSFDGSVKRTYLSTSLGADAISDTTKTDKKMTGTKTRRPRLNKK